MRSGLDHAQHDRADERDGGVGGGGAQLGIDVHLNSPVDVAAE